ncbi:MAG: acylphosphatase [Desulfovibrio sp.]
MAPNLEDIEIFHCTISGRVQGVAFRYYTQQHAQSVGVTGYVRNLSDGRVETAATGTRDQLRSFHIWLHSGSPAALVSTVECRTVHPASDSPTCIENRTLLEAGGFNEKSEFYTRFCILK